MAKKGISQLKDSDLIEEMAQKGLAFGHKTSVLHPNMKPYILGKRGRIHIIDLSKTIEKLNEALDQVKKLVAQEEPLLLVGTKVHLQNLVKDFAEEYDFFYVNQRWIGGTLTNFKVISQRVDHLQDLESKREKGELKKYTKKEQLEFDREINRLEKKFGGLKGMDELPAAVIILDMDKNDLADREARKKDITTFALADTNIDPELVDYPIPVNDDAISSVQYILERFGETIQETRLQQGKEKKKEQSSE